MLKKLLYTAMLTLAFLVPMPVTALAATYVVQNNDTMWSIAKNHGVSLKSLTDVNSQIRNPNQIWPGLSLQIPSQSPSHSTSGSNTAAQLTVQYATQVDHLVNQQRAANGLHPLRLDGNLSAMAMDKAVDMYEHHYFDHQSPTYGSPFDMMTHYGFHYSYAGENIAEGQTSPQAVMNDWMNSAGHRANILNAHYNTLGVAYYHGIWVQEFIGS